MHTAPPPAPSRSFASDNAAGAHPSVLEAMVAANDGHALAYGSDRWTAAAQDALRDLFGGEAVPFLVFNGTGANVMALATMVRPADCVVCTEWAHIAVDETGAPERALGAKLLTLPTPNAKLVPEQLRELAHFQGVMHHAQPGVVSITQATELGTLYTAEEVAALCDTAHAMGMRVHMDGARLANAAAALGASAKALRSFTVDAGVDVLSFGGTKAGLAIGEAVVYLNPELAERAKFVRKQVNQLPSKMRFIAAQFLALLDGDRWIELAAHANAMATLLWEHTRDLEVLGLTTPPAANSLFPVLPAAVAGPLQDWCFFWDWDISAGQYRWMTAWDTTVEDVERFVAGIRHFLALCN